jgi:hypothetical protein
MSNNSTKWQELVFRGVESDELDYKAAQDWEELTKAGKAKFVRHLLAFANTRGGYLVVGVGEDASGYPALRTGLTAKQCASFDPSKVGAFVNSHVEPPIKFTIERPLIKGNRYAIFVIHPFESLPHVCANGVDGELQAGVFYIRTADASSRPARRAMELADIIRRALRNQREMLGRMLRGILYENRTDFIETPSGTFDDAFTTASIYFRRRRPGDANTVQLSLVFAPEHRMDEAFETQELSAAVAAAGLPHPDGRFFTDKLMKSVRPVNTGLRCLSENSPCMWQLFKSGEFLFFADLQSSGGKINFEEVLKFAAETIVFAGKLYQKMISPEELLTITLKLSAPKQIRLKFNNRTPVGVSADTIASSICRSTADLASGNGELATRLCNELAEQFEISAKTISSMTRFITEYLSAL